MFFYLIRFHLYIAVFSSSRLSRTDFIVRSVHIFGTCLCIWKTKLIWLWSRVKISLHFLCVRGCISRPHSSIAIDTFCSLCHVKFNLLLLFGNSVFSTSFFFCSSPKMDDCCWFLIGNDLFICCDLWIHTRACAVSHGPQEKGKAKGRDVRRRRKKQFPTVIAILCSKT